MNDRHRPNFRGVRVAPGTGYDLVRGIGRGNSDVLSPVGVAVGIAVGVAVGIAVGVAARPTTPAYSQSFIEKDEVARGVRTSMIDTAQTFVAYV